jgi:hypothetical protein
MEKSFLSAGFLYLALSALITPHALADIDAPITTQFAFPHPPEKTTALRLTTARIVAIDYDLIAKDFPQLRRGPGEDENAWKWRIEDWVLRETSYIGKEQAAQNLVNTQISVNPHDERIAFRPNGYNRAFVLPVEGGLIDIKGVGSLHPAQRHHGNGLASLGETIREFIYEKNVSSILRHSRLNAVTVGSYAVLDFGFDIKNADGSQDRAGAILRQAHVRSTGFNSSLAPEKGLAVEKVLRRYGITSSGETFAMRPNFPWDYVNIQGTNNQDVAEVIDFGAYLGVDRFQHNLTNGNGHVYIYKDTPDFIQPDPQLRVPLSEWGDFGVHDPKRDRPWVYSHDLAKALAEGRADRTAVDAHLRNFFEPISEKFRGCGRDFHRLMAPKN